MNTQTKKIQPDEIPLDDYEQELQEFLDDGDFVSAPDFKDTKDMFVEAAKRHTQLQKTKSITLRVKQEDLVKLKAKAAHQNIPYQTLIGLLIHNYSEGRTKIALE